jgi:pimeloyl-ACP methyl ester carboxylesterase
MVDSAPAFVAEQKDAMWATIELDELANIECPLLLTQGDASPAWFSPIVAKLAGAIDHAEVHTYRRAGHAPHLTHPRDYLDTVTGFLSRSPVRDVEAGVVVG